MLRIKVTESGLVERRAEIIKERVANVGAEAGRQFSANIAEIAKQVLPTGGWYTIYREAITYFESGDGTEWAAAGLWPVSFSTFPGASTLVEFGGDTPVAGIMASRNPWPMDVIPGVTGGYRATAKAKQASETELERERARIFDVLETVKDELREIGGVTIEDDLFPIIAGEVYADIGWLAERLEHGLGGLPRLPVWARALTRSRAQLDKWAEQATPQMEQILRGAPTRTPVRQMPPDLLRALRAHRG